MTDIGYSALVLALVVSVFSAVAAFMGARGHQGELWASARNGVFVAFALLTLASAILLYFLLSHDFRVEYVSQYSSTAMSLVYTISAFWAGNQGSLLMWAWFLSLFLTLAYLQHRRTLPHLMPYVVAVGMAILSFFLVLLVFLANPFKVLPFPPAEGRGLNPLLENMGMLFHPTTLYIGYVGLAIPFVFAMAALITGRLGDDWLRATRRWTLLAWFFLGLGNLFGAAWAYVELGWGGHWGWDPVENASFMPWLVATAFLHSSMIQRRRGMLKIWNMALIIIVFELTIFGTLLTRSGVLSSVHSFAESGLGPFFLAFIAVSGALSIGLLFYRRERLRSEDELDSFISRESSFLFNNLLLVGAAFAVFWGTVFPLVSEWFRGVKITVGPPFFNQVVGPILLALLLLMGICPLIGWRRATPGNLIRNFLYPVGAALGLMVALFALGVRDGMALFALGVSAFVFAAILLEWFRGTRARARTRSQNWLSAFGGLVWANKPRYGGYVIHVAIVMGAVGIVGSSFFKAEVSATLAPGEKVDIGQYTLKYEGLRDYSTVDRQVSAAVLTVYNGEKFVDSLSTERSFYPYFNQTMTEVAIRTTLLEDIYVIYTGSEGQSASFKIIINPLEVWIWIGGVVTALGMVIAFWPDPREGLMLPREAQTS